MQHFKTLSPLLLVSVNRHGGWPDSRPARAVPVPPAPPPVPVVQQPRDVQSQTPPPTGTGSIVGSVTVADGGQAARKVRVTLSGQSCEAAGASQRTIRGGSASSTSLRGGSCSRPRSPGTSRSATASGGQARGDPDRHPALRQPEVRGSASIPRGGVITGSVLENVVKRFPAPTFGSCATRRRADNERCSRLATARRTIAGFIASTDSSRVNTSWRLRLATRERLTRSGCAEVEAMRTAAQNMGDARAAEARQLLDRVQAIQAQVTAATPDEPTTGYAPVYYPGTTSPASATSSTWVLPKKRVASTSS